MVSIKKIKDTLLRLGTSNDDGLSEAQQRKRATVWRLLTISQFIIGTGLMVAVFYFWASREIRLSVPEPILPGEYQLCDIPEKYFVDNAIDYTGLVGTYQPFSAKKQFEEALKMLTGNFQQSFIKEMLGIELRAIQTSRRSQAFFVDEEGTKVSRDCSNGVATVELAGVREKVNRRKRLPDAWLRYRFTMKSEQPDSLNPYSIVITDVEEVQL